MTTTNVVSDGELERMYILFQDNMEHNGEGLTVDEAGFHIIFDKLLYWWRHRADLRELSFKVGCT